MDVKIRSEVDLKYFGERVKIEKELNVGNEEERYVYQVNCKGDIYILKGFKIHLEHLNPKNKKSADLFMTSLTQINEVFQEYYFAKTPSLFNPHIAAPLFMDFKIDLAEDKSSRSYMYIEIIFEHAGSPLASMQTTTLELTYNLMRQSANALLLLHNVNIAHFDIKPDNMVYDSKKDLLKITNMGSAFDQINKKKVTDTTAILEDKIRSTTLGFAPPEVLSMAKGLDPNLELTPAAVDVYCWAMSFFAILTKATNPEMNRYNTKYRSGSEATYKGFLEVVEASFDSIISKNSKQEELKKVVSSLLIEALHYKPKERPKMKDIIDKMKLFEKEKKFMLPYSNNKLENNKSMPKPLMDNDYTDRSLNEVKTKSPVADGMVVKLSCKHKVTKDCLVKYTLELFIQERPYEHNCFCKACKRVQKIKSLSLSCGCICKTFGEKIKCNKDLTKADYGKCDKDHPLTSIDLGLLNDFISSKFTSLMITDYLQEKEMLVNSFNEAVKKESLEGIAWVLKYSKNVKKLCLSQKNIGDEGAKVIGEALRANTTLKELNLSKNNIRAEGAKVIIEALRTNTTTIVLSLSENSIGDEGAKIIGEALRTNTILIRLCLNSNNIGDEGAKAIANALRTNTTLTVLKLCTNRIGIEGTKAIAEALRINIALAKLELPNNYIGVEGGKAIGESLITNTTLKDLDIRNNNIGGEGAKVISNGLRTNTTLVSLDLGKNKIKDEGVEVIGEALKINTTLRTLSLKNNGIEIEGAKVISEVLRTNTTLTKLYLSDNNIGDKGARLICEALKINTTLSELSLVNIKLGTEGKDLLKQVKGEYKHIEINY